MKIEIGSIMINEDYFNGIIVDYNDKHELKKILIERFKANNDSLLCFVRDVCLDLYPTFLNLFLVRYGDYRFAVSKDSNVEETLDNLSEVLEQCCEFYKDLKVMAVPLSMMRKIVALESYDELFEASLYYKLMIKEIVPDEKIFI